MALQAMRKEYITQENLKVTTKHAYNLLFALLQAQWIASYKLYKIYTLLYTKI